MAAEAEAVHLAPDVGADADAGIDDGLNGEHEELATDEAEDAGIHAVMLHSLPAECYTLAAMKLGTIAVCPKCDALCDTYDSRSRYFGTNLISKCCSRVAIPIDYSGFPQ